MLRKPDFDNRGCTSNEHCEPGESCLAVPGTTAMICGYHVAVPKWCISYKNCNDTEICVGAHTSCETCPPNPG